MKIYGKLLKKNGMKLYTLWVERKKTKKCENYLGNFFFCQIASVKIILHLQTCLAYFNRVKVRKVYKKK